MPQRCAHLLTLLVALFAGFVPLHECHATGTGEGGAVVVGAHAHHGHDACNHEESRPDPTHDGEDGHDACCVDTPFLGSLPAASIGFEAALAPSSALATGAGFVVEAPAPSVWDGTAELAIPRGTRTIVLLR